MIVTRSQNVFWWEKAYDQLATFRIYEVRQYWYSCSAHCPHCKSSQVNCTYFKTEYWSCSAHFLAVFTANPRKWTAYTLDRIQVGYNSQGPLYSDDLHTTVSKKSSHLTRKIDAWRWQIWLVHKFCMNWKTLYIWNTIHWINLVISLDSNHRYWKRQIL